MAEFVLTQTHWCDFNIHPFIQCFMCAYLRYVSNARISQALLTSKQITEFRIFSNFKIFSFLFTLHVPPPFELVLLLFKWKRFAVWRRKHEHKQLPKERDSTIIYYGLSNSRIRYAYIYSLHNSGALFFSTGTKLENCSRDKRKFSCFSVLWGFLSATTLN